MPSAGLTPATRLLWAPWRRIRPRPVRKADLLPTVSIIVAAHDEEAVIRRRVENLLALDYPPERVEIVVASDASGDQTDEIVRELERAERRVRLLPCPRGGKVNAQNLAVRRTTGEIVAFSDANATWAPDALRRLVRSFADPDVAYVCGSLRLEESGRDEPRGLLLAITRRGCASRSRCSGRSRAATARSTPSRRTDYVEVDPRFGHDLALPYLMVQRGRRAVYEREADAFEKPSRDLEDEYRRKVRMFEHCWLILLRGRMLEDVDRTYLRRARLPSSAPLRERPPAPRPARHERRARRAERPSTGSSSRRSLPGCRSRPPAACGLPSRAPH